MTVADNQAHLTWTGGSVPYTVQRRETVSGADWANAMTTMNQRGIVPLESAAAFYQVTSRVRLSVTLDGAAERPDPVVTEGTGIGTFVLDGNALTVEITYSGLSVPASAAHIHGPGTVEEAVGVLVDLQPLHEGDFATSGRFAGSVTVSDATVQALLDGLTYVNIHTANHPGGEIRGQITR